MRSLEDWTRYLDEQEASLQRQPRPAAAPPLESEAAAGTRQRLLSGAAQPEVTQNSYKGFKESREEFLLRLLDPPLTLEETARVLNVCPTTVRRYTNKGLLRHFRTAGNQRRFRLSDVLDFVAKNPGSADADS